VPIINLQLTINAPQQRVFDLARSLEMHLASTEHTGERVVAGRTSGLFELHDEVTWQAKHLGIWQQLSVRITEMQPYSFFADEMVSGAFHNFRHEHKFIRIDNNTTLMEDMFTYRSPFGLLGSLADKLFLQKYMTNLLLQRNLLIKTYAEGEKWQRILP
jgi:ligand-binding SRPBCC domain-containing protein